MHRPHARRAQVLLTIALFLAGCEDKPAAKPQKAPEVAVEASPDRSVSGTPRSDRLPPPWSVRRTPQSGFPCLVEDVLARSCRRCHWNPQENDAPFALASWEDTRKERSGKPIFQLMGQMVEAELMPPLDLHLDPPVAPLAEAQKKALLDWIRQGAKRSDEVCEQSRRDAPDGP